MFASKYCSSIITVYSDARLIIQSKSRFTLSYSLQADFTMHHKQGTVLFQTNKLKSFMSTRSKINEHRNFFNVNKWRFNQSVVRATSSRSIYHN